MFAIWDWMFGTLYLPTKEKEEFSFGLADGTEKEYSSILRLYSLPLIKLHHSFSPQ
jgi:sterol desaturase/sphingolipid hydroxylase (fatty acid hydroxylase superfamily)